MTPNALNFHLQLSILNPILVFSESLTRFKPALQSSTFMNYTAGLAVDGDRSPDTSQSSCSVTYNQLNPWWAVDLTVGTYINNAP
jgi:hypothetical protein